MNVARGKTSPWWFSIGQVAEICGVSERTIRRWRNAGFPAPDEDTGRYDIRLVGQYLRAQATQPGAADREQWEVEKLRRQVSKLDYELARLHAEVVEWDVVEDWIAEFGRLVAGVIERAQQRCEQTCGEGVGRVLMDGLKQLEAAQRRRAGKGA